MAKSRNIDIVKVPKQRPTRNKAPSLDIRPPKPIDKKSQAKPQTKKYKKVPRKQRAGISEVLVSAWQGVFSADIFQMSFVRNLFSLRVIFFAALPIAVYQLRYVFVLKPDELLDGLRGFLAVENTTNILVFGLTVVTLAVLSWLADTLITPSIIRFRFSRLDNRSISMGRSIREASSEVLHNVAQKTVKLLVLLTLLAFVIGAGYASYVLGYGSISEQTSFIIGFGSLFGVILVYYFALRFWLQVISSVGGTAEHSRVGLGFKQLFYHPLISFGYGIIWIVALSIVVCASLAVTALVIYWLDNTDSVSLHILILAGSTTLICVLWSVWTAWQNGYWTKMIHSRSRTIPLVMSQSDELKYWHFLVLIIVVLLVISSYVVFAFVFSDQIYKAIGSLKSALPETFKLNLPKPQ